MLTFTIETRADCGSPVAVQADGNGFCEHCNRTRHYGRWKSPLPYDQDLKRDEWLGCAVMAAAWLMTGAVMMLCMLALITAIRRVL